jgi:hypothetical protein
MKKTLLIGLAIIIFLSIVGSASAGWANSSYDRCKTINITNVGSSTLTDFPLYINLSYDGDMLSNYADLNFFNTSCNNDGGQLSFELENYTATQANIHVKIPSFLTGTSQISVYYKNNTATTSLSSGANTFGASYDLVWHLSSLTDSSGNANHGLVTGALDTISGMVGSASTWDGLNDYVNVTSDVSETDDLTISMWAKTTATATYDTLFRGLNTEAGYFTGYLNVPSAGQATFYYGSSSAANSLASVATGMNDGVWRLYTFQKSGAQIYLYINGALDGNRTWVDSTVTASPLKFGYHTTADRWMNGSMDEIRYTNTVLSAGWINQTYQQVANQALFIKFNSEQEKPETVVPVVTLNSPLATILTTSYALFNCTASDNVGLSAIKLYINGVVNQTNNTPINNTPWTYNLSMANGNYTWNCEANDTTNNKANGTQSWVYINYTAPPYLSYSQNSTNSTIAGTSIMHRLLWNTSGTLDSYIFQFCNGTWNTTTSTCVGGAGSNNLTILNSSFIQVDDDTYGAANAVLCYVDDPGDGGTSYGDCAQRWNLSSISSSATLTDVQMCFTNERGDTLDDNDTVSLWGITNTTWTASTINFHNSSMGYTNFKNITGAQIGPNGVGVRTCLNVTSWFAQQFAGGNYSISFDMYIESDTEDAADDYFAMDSSEAAIVANRPSLNVTYTIPSSGGWVNDSAVAFTTNWSNVTKTIGSTVGLNYSWCVYANTTAGTTNNSCATPFTYTSTSAGQCLPPAINNDWYINFNWNCNVVGLNILLGTGNLYLGGGTGSPYAGCGNFTLTNTNITLHNYVNNVADTEACHFFKRSGSRLIFQ